MVDNWIFVSTLLIVQLGLHKLCFWYHLESAPKLMNKLFDQFNGKQDPVFDLSFSCWLWLDDSRTYVTFVFLAILLHNNIQCQISYIVLFLTVQSKDQTIFFFNRIHLLVYYVYTVYLYTIYPCFICLLSNSCPFQNVHL